MQESRKSRPIIFLRSCLPYSLPHGEPSCRISWGLQAFCEALTDCGDYLTDARLGMRMGWGREPISVQHRHSRKPDERYAPPVVRGAGVAQPGFARSPKLVEQTLGSPAFVAKNVGAKIPHVPMILCHHLFLIHDRVMDQTKYIAHFYGTPFPRRARRLPAIQAAFYPDIRCRTSAFF